MRDTIILKMKTRLDFGKYRGLKIMNIVRDPEVRTYLRYLHTSKNNITCHKSLVDVINIYAETDGASEL